MKLDISNALKFVDKQLYDQEVKCALDSLNCLNQGLGKGNEFLGWINLPQNFEEGELNNIQNIAESFKKLDAVVLIGIGGSYLGSRAFIEALKPYFEKSNPEILYAGHNINGAYISELIEHLNDKDFGIIVISKSGTTTEPAIAFRLLFNEMKSRYNTNEIKERLIVITDENRGSLRELVETENYTNFVISDDIGGRFSVLSPVGLVPIAIAGHDIKEILRGASIAQDVCFEKSENNPAIKYASIRNSLYKLGLKIEILANYRSELNFLSEWWKQLFGESQGKDGKGIFPASTSFSTDLHSLGQYIQQGEKQLFETVIYINDSENSPNIPFAESDFDGLNYLAGKNVEYVNKKAFEGTLIAHTEGKVPNIIIEFDEINEFTLGYLIYFFEVSCSISSYMLDINPFDQPGVEFYKKNMFKLLGKQ